MKTPVARGVWSGVGAGALGVAWRKDREKKCLTIFVPAVWSELGLNGRQTNCTVLSSLSDVSHPASLYPGLTHPIRLPSSGGDLLGTWDLYLRTVLAAVQHPPPARSRRFATPPAKRLRPGMPWPPGKRGSARTLTPVTLKSSAFSTRGVTQTASISLPRIPSWSPVPSEQGPAVWGRQRPSEAPSGPGQAALCGGISPARWLGRLCSCALQDEAGLALFRYFTFCPAEESTFSGDRFSGTHLSLCEALGASGPVLQVVGLPDGISRGAGGTLRSRHTGHLRGSSSGSKILAGPSEETL
ncbi:uncharacterized protein LOC105080060 [Camelus bactrianus]|uniref:Uncharacterized protein LOC105080060 n=2 Tax=Camelus bactrianus TaxID=9837 RepID=A0AC58QP88_CAMBA